MNQYTGPAPVSLADYTMRVGMQSVQKIALKPADISRAFYQMVLDQDMLTRLGTALVSGTSMFLHGPSGTGKTSLASTIPAVYNDSVWIPHAIVVDNQIVSVFDPGLHFPSSTEVRQSPTGDGCCAVGRASSPAANFPRKCWTCSSTPSASSTPLHCK